jgi:predicted RNA-binding Zn-ribbon protein involved in translation (DUF1610 family)
MLTVRTIRHMDGEKFLNLETFSGDFSCLECGEKSMYRTGKHPLGRTVQEFACAYCGYTDDRKWIVTEEQVKDCKDETKEV